MLISFGTRILGRRVKTHKYKIKEVKLKKKKLCITKSKFKILAETQDIFSAKYIFFNHSVLPHNLEMMTNL